MPLKRASLLVLFLTIFIDLLGFGIVIPLLPYYARQFGGSGTWVGIVVGVFSAMQFLFAPVLGRLSDRIGRRPVLLVSLAGSLAGYALFAFADSLGGLILARVVAGIAGANIGTAQAYIADSTSLEERAKGMGLIGAAFGLGFILGPPIGGLTSAWGTSHGYSSNFVPGLIAAALSLTALLFAFFALGESRKPSSPVRSRLPPQFDPAMWRLIASRPVLGTVIAALALVIFSFAGMETTVTLFARREFEFTARDLGFFFGFMGLVVAVIQGTLIGRLARAVGERTLMAIGTLSLLTGVTAVPLIGDERLLWPVALLVAVGQGLCYPSMHSIVSGAAPQEQLGSVLGVSASMGSLARMLGPVVFGTLWDAGGAPGAFWSASLCVLIALVLALRLRSAERVAGPASRRQSTSV
ncbi:MAG TPA: MFS transporter [Thermoanaerobaculia bacterium]|nr:MFS transporter [Thermoanaerobaculia bacterium]